ncbi:MAG TPA: hypothetical protein VHZ76_08755, partial [Gammaproteobacteria bacterium]|nr:hypothetical protein [Gammaproteobacteria bacterium]
ILPEVISIFAAALSLEDEEPKSEIDVQDLKAMQGLNVAIQAFVRLFTPNGADANGMFQNVCLTTCCVGLLVESNTENCSACEARLTDANRIPDFTSRKLIEEVKKINELIKQAELTQSNIPEAFLQQLLSAETAEMRKTFYASHHINDLKKMFPKLQQLLEDKNIISRSDSDLSLMLLSAESTIKEWVTYEIFAYLKWRELLADFAGRMPNAHLISLLISSFENKADDERIIRLKLIGADRIRATLNNLSAIIAIAENFSTLASRKVFYDFLGKPHLEQILHQFFTFTDTREFSKTLFLFEILDLFDDNRLIILLRATYHPNSNIKLAISPAARSAFLQYLASRGILEEFIFPQLANSVPLKAYIKELIAAPVLDDSMRPVIDEINRIAALAKVYKKNKQEAVVQELLTAHSVSARKDIYNVFGVEYLKIVFPKLQRLLADKNVSQTDLRKKIISSDDPIKELIIIESYAHLKWGSLLADLTDGMTVADLHVLLAVTFANKPDEQKIIGLKLIGAERIRVIIDDMSDVINIAENFETAEGREAFYTFLDKPHLHRIASEFFAFKNADPVPLKLDLLFETLNQLSRDQLINILLNPNNNWTNARFRAAPEAYRTFLSYLKTRGILHELILQKQRTFLIDLAGGITPDKLKILLDCFDEEQQKIAALELFGRETIRAVSHNLSAIATVRNAFAAPANPKVFYEFLGKPHLQQVIHQCFESPDKLSLDASGFLFDLLDEFDNEELVNVLIGPYHHLSNTIPSRDHFLRYLNARDRRFFATNGFLYGQQILANIVGNISVLLPTDLTRFLKIFDEGSEQKLTILRLFGVENVRAILHDLPALVNVRDLFVTPEDRKEAFYAFLGKPHLQQIVNQAITCPNEISQLHEILNVFDSNELIAILNDPNKNWPTIVASWELSVRVAFFQYLDDRNIFTDSEFRNSQQWLSHFIGETPTDLHMFLTQCDTGAERIRVLTLLGADNVRNILNDLPAIETVLSAFTPRTVLSLGDNDFYRRQFFAFLGKPHASKIIKKILTPGEAELTLMASTLIHKMLAAFEDHELKAIIDDPDNDWLGSRCWIMTATHVDVGRALFHFFHDKGVLIHFAERLCRNFNLDDPQPVVGKLERILASLRRYVGYEYINENVTPFLLSVMQSGLVLNVQQFQSLLAYFTNHDIKINFLCTNDVMLFGRKDLTLNYLAQLQKTVGIAQVFSKLPQQYHNELIQIINKKAIEEKVEVAIGLSHSFAGSTPIEKLRKFTETISANVDDPWFIAQLLNMEEIKSIKDTLAPLPMQSNWLFRQQSSWEKWWSTYVAAINPNDTITTGKNANAILAALVFAAMADVCIEQLQQRSLKTVRNIAASLKGTSETKKTAAVRALKNYALMLGCNIGELKGYEKEFEKSGTVGDLYRLFVECYLPTMSKLPKEVYNHHCAKKLDNDWIMPSRDTLPNGMIVFSNSPKPIPVPEELLQQPMLEELPQDNTNQFKYMV